MSFVEDKLYANHGRDQGILLWGRREGRSRGGREVGKRA
jgi:hypothetical protein